MYRHRAAVSCSTCNALNSMEYGPHLHCLLVLKVTFRSIATGSPSSPASVHGCRSFPLIPCGIRPRHWVFLTKTAKSQFVQNPGVGRFDFSTLVDCSAPDPIYDSAYRGFRIRKRTLAGLKATRVRDRDGGRPEKLSVRDKQQIRAGSKTRSFSTSRDRSGPRL